MGEKRRGNPGWRHTGDGGMEAMTDETKEKWAAVAHGLDRAIKADRNLGWILPCEKAREALADLQREAEERERYTKPTGEERAFLDGRIYHQRMELSKL